MSAALRALDQTMNNLTQLKRIWTELEAALGSALEGNWVQDDWRLLTRKAAEFRVLLQKMPSVNGVKLVDALPDYGEISQGIRDAHDIGEAGILQEVIEGALAQDAEILKYEQLLVVERHRVIRDSVNILSQEITAMLDQLLASLDHNTDVDTVPDNALPPLTDKIQEFSTLIPGTIRRPSEWADLMRHLRFRQVHDIRNIRQRDWPKISKAILDQLEIAGGEVAVSDIGELRPAVALAVQATVRIEWDRLDAQTFERLCADMLSCLPHWENVNWLTATNASDRGRDIEAWVISHHPLLGTVKHRVLVQCKHYPNGSVSVKDIEPLQNLVYTHGQVDLVLVITSGKFTDQLVQVAKGWNDRNPQTKVELWERWRLETELARVPSLKLGYGL